MAYSADLLQVVKVEKCSKIDRFSCSPQTQSLLEDVAPAANVIGDIPETTCWWSSYLLNKRRSQIYHS